MSLPAKLPSISKARLPQVYENAKGALQECARIDECKDWADKAEALASYAKQAKDDSLHKMAVRIQARAIRRCGALLEQIESRAGRPKRNSTGSGTNKTRAATEAGMSRRQRHTALRVARVPEGEFESAVESDSPPSVTKLAEQGKLPQVGLDLQGRDPEEFAVATVAGGHLDRFCGFIEDGPTPVAVVRGFLDKERKGVLRQAKMIRRWLDRFIAKLEAR